mmetsp:Transcript_1112/g.2905  ORF Transcript_1112/g.2905 Transcript_1112/m.2905 type:complete len:215 (+) Transcript_1112:310-954(+)
MFPSAEGKLFFKKEGALGGATAEEPGACRGSCVAAEADALSVGGSGAEAGDWLMLWGGGLWLWGVLYRRSCSEPPLARAKSRTLGPLVREPPELSSSGETGSVAPRKCTMQACLPSAQSTTASAACALWPSSLSSNTFAMPSCPRQLARTQRAVELRLGSGSPRRRAVPSNSRPRDSSRARSPSGAAGAARIGATSRGRGRPRRAPCARGPGLL